ncbi:hypothetical protein AU468_12910 [Alkalispirochaeta sphaeroplastigenens]|uniref:Uncharacterized protein n=2 Tax=Alkalispirochaeta sphaeroplastigenens TaxID=1187066 RepID=A0A2S4JG45_9SPIO|nr:hypothetical protein AU468_12910 [Alkalispirochaeta sphaeroplastigenens]
MDLQDLLFQRYGLDSTRLFPPLIPLAPLSPLNAPPCPPGVDPQEISATIRTLERLRKKHLLQCLTAEETGGRACDAPDTSNSPDSREGSPWGFPLEIRGFRELREALPGGSSSRATDARPSDGGCGGSLLERSFSTPQSRIVCSWEPREIIPPEAQRFLLNQKLSVPATRAFWLSAISISPGPEPLSWWRGACWQEIFCRRTTVRETPPARGS